jgi:hypothetical protein
MFFLLFKLFFVERTHKQRRISRLLYGHAPTIPKCTLLQVILSRYVALERGGLELRGREGEREREREREKERETERERERET